ncbi:MAG: nucleotide exchange factor GrpE [Planctomycetota bacterium]|jgi:hypothetical protein
MWKKSIIFGLILLLGGAAAVSWALIEQRKEKQLLQEQLEILNARLTELDKLITGEIDIPSFAKIISVEDWHQKLNQHKEKKKTRNLTLNTGVVCMLTGGAVFTWWLLLWMARIVIYGWSYLSNLSYLNRFFISVFRRCEQIKNKQPADSHAKEKEDNKASKQKKKPRRQQSRLEKRSEALEVSGWHNFDKNRAEQQEPAQLQTKPLAEDEPSPDRSAEEAEKIAVLYTDEESIEHEKTLKLETEQSGSDTEQPDTLTEHIRKTVSSATDEESVESGNSLKRQKDDIKKQVAEFEQMADKTVQQRTDENSEPFNDSLKELTRQVAAIREYASQQQERVDKLQEGYDWNITRTFCLKLIRCIDNLENRIFQLSRRNIDAPNLEEIKDELIFALESSGVEQFKPKLRSDYRGQEKTAEAVKERECSDDPMLKGKIAKVIRPGYQYVIDEQNVRIVRTARVKLFG